MNDNEEKSASRLKILWIVSFILATVCSCIYEVFYPSASPFPSVQSAVLATILLLYFYPLTVAMRDAAKSAKRKKLYAFSRVMAIFFSVSGVFVISYLVIALLK